MIKKIYTYLCLAIIAVPVIICMPPFRLYAAPLKGDREKTTDAETKVPLKRKISFEDTSLMKKILEELKGKHIYNLLQNKKVIDIVEKMGESAVADLIVGLHSKYDYFCFNMLAHLGKNARGALDILEKIEGKQKETALRTWIKIRLAGLTGEERLNAVWDAYNHSNIMISSLSKREFEYIPGTLTNRIINRLLEDLEGEKENIAKSALIRIGRPAVSYLKKKLFTKNTMSIMDILGELGPDARDATLYLAEVLEQSKNIDIIKKVLWVLKKIGPYARPAVPVLIKLFHENNTKITFVLTRAIVSIGGAPKDIMKIILTHPKAEYYFNRGNSTLLEDGLSHSDPEIKKLSIKFVSEFKFGTKKLNLFEDAPGSEMIKGPAFGKWTFYKKHISKGLECAETHLIIRTNGKNLIWKRSGKDSKLLRDAIGFEKCLDTTTYPTLLWRENKDHVFYFQAGKIKGTNGTLCRLALDDEAVVSEELAYPYEPIVYFKEKFYYGSPDSLDLIEYNPATEDEKIIINGPRAIHFDPTVEPLGDSAHTPFSCGIRTLGTIFFYQNTPVNLKDFAVPVTIENVSSKQRKKIQDAVLNAVTEFFLNKKKDFDAWRDNTIKNVPFFLKELERREGQRWDITSDGKKGYKFISHLPKEDEAIIFLVWGRAFPNSFDKQRGYTFFPDEIQVLKRFKAKNGNDLKAIIFDSINTDSPLP